MPIAGDSYELPTELPYGLKSAVTRLGVRILTINFRADPAKRDKAWIEAASVGYSDRRWDREMENDWAKTDGKPVYPDFDKLRHVSRIPLKVERGQPVLVGWDHGFSPAAVFSQSGSVGDLRLLRAVNEDNCATPRFAPLVIDMMCALNAEAGYEPVHTWLSIKARAAQLLPLCLSRLLAEAQGEDTGPNDAAERQTRAARMAVCAAMTEAFEHGLEFIHVGDPAGTNRQSNEGRSAVDLLRSDFGIHVQSRAKDQSTKKRVNAVTKIIAAPDIAPGVPAFVVSKHPSCDRLIDGFEGAYVYTDTADSREHPEPKKDKFSHPQDCVQYLVLWQFPDGAVRAVSETVMTDGEGKGVGEAPSRFDYLETDRTEAERKADEELARLLAPMDDEEEEPAAAPLPYWMLPATPVATLDVTGARGL